MLKLKNVSVNLDTTEVLKNINLTVNPGEIHAIMGPKRSGKSTLAHIIQGNPFITIADGTIQYKGKTINKLPAHKRSQQGIFTSFQYPPDIEGMTNLDMVRTIFENSSKKQLTSELEVAYRSLLHNIKLDEQFLEDPVNTQIRDREDHKKGEILQMIMLQPDVVVLDEIDLDVSDEGVEIIARMVKNYFESGSKALIIITNNHNLLNLLTPNYVHILVNGEIREQGTTELYKRIIEDGYSQFSQS
jgi:Fe-S cluster assembly ATP-binding protein